MTSKAVSDVLTKAQLVEALTLSIFDNRLTHEQHLSAITIALALIVCPAEVCEAHSGDGRIALQYKNISAPLPDITDIERSRSIERGIEAAKLRRHQWRRYSNNKTIKDSEQYLPCARAWIHSVFLDAPSDTLRAVALGFAWSELCGEPIAHPSSIRIDHLNIPGRCNLTTTSRGLSIQFDSEKVVWCKFPGLGCWSRGSSLFFFRGAATHEAERVKRGERVFLDVQRIAVNPDGESRSIKVAWLLCSENGEELDRGLFVWERGHQSTVPTSSMHKLSDKAGLNHDIKANPILSLAHVLRERHLVLRGNAETGAALREVASLMGIPGILGGEQSICDVNEFGFKCSLAFTADFARLAEKFHVNLDLSPNKPYAMVDAIKSVYDRLKNGFEIPELM